MPITNDHIKDIYFAFRKAQADFKKRGFKMPKDFDAHIEKMKPQNRKKLIKVTGNFLTKWSNIDPYNYFLCGFELYKTFSYVMFLNKDILQLYIRRDTNKKRETEITKKGLIKSAKFVKKFMNENNISTLDRYINIREGSKRIAIEHYVKNKIDASFFVFLHRKGMFLTDTERSDIPYISINYRKIVEDLNEISDFIKQMERKL